MMEPNGQAAESKDQPSQKEVSDSDNSSNRNVLKDGKCYAPKSWVHFQYIGANTCVIKNNRPCY